MVSLRLELIAINCAIDKLGIWSINQKYTWAISKDRVFTLNLLQAELILTSIDVIIVATSMRQKEAYLKLDFAV
jgi:hypothetical protein